MTEFQKNPAISSINRLSVVFIVLKHKLKGTQQFQKPNTVSKTSTQNTIIFL